MALFLLTSIVCITVTHRNPSQQPEKQRYKWWQLPQRVQIDGRKHNYPIFQWMKAWQELYSPQEQSKARSQPNFFHSTEIILLEETEVCEEKQHQSELQRPTCWHSFPSFILSSPKASRNVESRQRILGLQLWTQVCWGRRLLPLFPLNSWSLGLHSTDGTYEWISACLGKVMPLLTKVSHQGDLKGSPYWCPQSLLHLSFMLPMP